jgi:flagellar biogenesis protein FliO
VLDVLIVAGLIVLVIWLLRRLLRAAPAVAKPVAVPVQGGFMVWLPKQ